MRKFLKSTFILAAVLVAIIFINGCIYVFTGQDRTMNKILAGEKVSLYEKCSIYTMHMAVYMFGWPLSPEAAGEIFRMSFPWNRGESIFDENDYFMDSPTIQKAFSTISKRLNGCIHIQ